MRINQAFVLFKLNVKQLFHIIRENKSAQQENERKFFTCDLWPSL